MPRDKRRPRGLNEVQYATKRVLRSSSISKVESVNSTETGECAGDTVQRTTGSSIALSDGKTKISDNLGAVNASKTDERHLSEDLISQAAASNFKPTVVSLASFEGDTMLVECTGVCIECPDPNSARFLTSLSLCTSSDGRRMASDNFRIEVSFPNGVLDGQLVYYDSYYGIAVVSTQHVPVCEGDHRLVLNHDEALKSSSEVVALWCSSSSEKLMAKSGQLIGPLDGTVHKLMFSTCKITTAGIGGPLIDIDGNFVGMNYYSQMGDCSQKVITPCLPRNLILKCMEHSGILRLETKQEGDGTIGSSTGTREICKSSTHGNFYQEGFFTMNPDHEKYVKETAKSYGYPLPDLLQANMYMVNTFEENFVKDTWTKLGKDVASKMSESVVPLASFND
ncbi:uncharacterized protein LOC119275592 isoform X2 [Triticum dicoccoides]|uniref:uncharacterized protein LOC119275592 isoform X2 n=1 Tax=Triticum dicoccoides TaxID=85692 RepID=UPI00189073EF|nr:uncharacterized protein LOC119275592 isoform X2 [Triticum dicoccoides]